MAVMTYREALNMALREEMRRDPNVFVIGEEVGLYEGAYKVTQGLLKEFGAQRVVDTPIAESGFTGVGIGAAMAGLRPVVEMMTFNFALLALDQIVNSAAKMYYMSGGQFNVPIVIRGPGGPAAQLAAQHSQSMETYFYHVPGLKVVRPTTPMDAKGLLKSSIRDDNPVIFIESETLYNVKGEVPEDPDFLIPLGKAIVRREGTDVTVIAYMGMMYRAMEAAEELAKEGISVELVDPRTLRPMDTETIIGSLRKNHRVVSWEAGAGFSWLGPEIAAPVTVEAFGAGVLRKILVPAGTSAPIGTLIGVIAEPGDDITALVASAPGGGAGAGSGAQKTPLRPEPAPAPPPGAASAAPQAPRQAVAAPSTPQVPVARPALVGAQASVVAGVGPGQAVIASAPAAAAAPAAGASAGGRGKASPLAQESAAPTGGDLRLIQGSGPG